ncbi:MAG: type II toxin-antitoxin system RelE/ParE family toxin [Xanthobacteraceae bacterium]|nr:type II toxin-antitoxin system RelE/ParE family toxin [Xanthobacteraceae bacterium]
MKVRYSARARADLAAILDYIDEKSPRGAWNVKRALQRTIELIGEYPHVGRSCGEQQARVVPVGRYPYLVYWTVEEGEVWVVHIRHSARAPWQDRQ